MASCHTHAATKLSSHRSLRSLTICAHLWNLWEALLRLKLLWIPWIPWENILRLKLLWILCNLWEDLRKQTWNGFCGRNSEGGVGMAGMPYPPTSVKICAICGRISSAWSFCEFCEFCGRTYANKLGVGSVEGIRRAVWVWQGCHTLLRKLPQIAQMCTD